MRIFGIVLALLVVALSAAAWWVSQPAFDEPLGEAGDAFEVLPLADALTLARSTSGALLLVTAANADTATAIDINQQLGTRYPETLAAYRALGYEGLAAAAAGTPQTLPMTDLGIPFTPQPRQIAAGTNFRAHAEEVGLDGEPFLFPKLTAPTRWNADVPPRGRLDYEAELCVVPLWQHTSAAAAPLGYVLCNDYTDRWALLREIDLDAPMGETGFPDAKGGPGMLPVGPFLVIPKNDAALLARITLRLGLNGALRQRAAADLMVWPPGEIASRALDACNTDYRSKTAGVRLTSCDGIEAGTLLLTGTPEGVLFHVANIWASAAYLGEGDEVITYGSHLGALRNAIH